MMAPAFQLLSKGKVGVQIAQGAEGSESDTTRGHRLKRILSWCEVIECCHGGFLAAITSCRLLVFERLSLRFVFVKPNHLLAAGCLTACLSIAAQTVIAPVTNFTTEIRYAHAAEADPLTPVAHLQREEAMRFSGADHSSHVILCHRLFKDVKDNPSANAVEMTHQYLASASAFLYEHPPSASDHTAQNLAGIDAALNVYEKFLDADPSTRSPFLDSLQQERMKGTLHKRVSSLCP